MPTTSDDGIVDGLVATSEPAEVIFFPGAAVFVEHRKLGAAGATNTIFLGRNKYDLFHNERTEHERSR